ncbi:MAG TPA: hypothetical protein VEH07_03765 [Alphaproteobacteria bacterium]|nr:hypothetical protein [Alphaproteobacteria bacterium]
MPTTDETLKSACLDSATQIWLAILDKDPNVPHPPPPDVVEGIVQNILGMSADMYMRMRAAGFAGT